MFLRWLLRKLEIRRVIYEKLNMSDFTYVTQECVDKIRDEIQFFGLKVQKTQGLIIFSFLFLVQIYQLLVQMLLRTYHYELYWPSSCAEYCSLHLIGVPAFRFCYAFSC